MSQIYGLSLSIIVAFDNFTISLEKEATQENFSTRALTWFLKKCVAIFRISSRQQQLKFYLH